MRVKYIGLDNRLRVVKTNRIKFLEDGFKATDRRDEIDNDVKGPVVIAHVYRSKGGKRLLFSADEEFNMEEAQNFVLEKGYLDLTMCQIKAENFY